MIVTEKQAAALRCCGPDGTGLRQTTKTTTDTARYCIGSACMAWHPEMLTTSSGQPGEFTIAATGRGSCGLANQ